MAKILWDQVGSRYYEAGVDRGVLYTTNNTGIAWNGLTSVTETSSGGEPTPYYLDGVKYLNVPGLEDFGGTIEAYTYPDEFAVHDGTAQVNGLQIHQQRRKPFNLSYRTGVGNDIDGMDHAYKVHLIYNALAMPSESAYSTLSDDPEAMTFSWSFTTTPVRSLATLEGKSFLPMAHITLDSRTSSSAQLHMVEEYLYGTDGQPARMPTIDQLFGWYGDPLFSYRIYTDSETGISTLQEANIMSSDLVGKSSEGEYLATDNTRLTETYRPGLYRLEE